MGRYDGEDYEVGPPCPPDKHEFMPNGMCHVCRRSKEGLINNAIATIEHLGSEELQRLVQKTETRKIPPTIRSVSKVWCEECGDEFSSEKEAGDHPFPCLPRFEHGEEIIVEEHPGKRYEGIFMGFWESTTVYEKGHPVRLVRIRVSDERKEISSLGAPVYRGVPISAIRKKAA